MNFLSHFVMAARTLVPPTPLYVMANALPDLLPLAAPRARLRLLHLNDAPQRSPADLAMTLGAQAHLLTDTVFHTAPAFAEACDRAGALADAAGFEAMRARRFFLAHVLTELALDAWLVRREPSLLTEFYALLGDADTAQVTRWAEQVTQRPLLHLPHTLARFVQSRYLRHYITDAGVAEGFNRLCARARQDIFTGPNEGRLVRLTGQIVDMLDAGLAQRLLDETSDGLRAALPTPPKSAG